MMENKLSLHNLGDQLAVAALRLLQKRGPMLASDVADALENNPAIDDPAREIYKSQGWPKWRCALNFQSTPFVHADILRKERKTWSLTDGGKKQMDELSDAALIEFAARKYKEREQMKAGKGADKAGHLEADDDSVEVESPRLARGEQALAEIKEFMRQMDPYEFQNLVAALLGAMGYFIADLADRPGGDGGVDIIAYDNPLGASGARLKVQVKRYKDSSPSVKDVRELHGLLTEGEAGVFVCTSDFSAKSREFARTAQKHLRLIDGDEFIRLWIEFHPKMKDEDKKRLPLYAVYFLDEESIPD